ncbi:hypothetical protein MtrunA17_Chr5g0429371 [Medicago truncatula]|uniref:Uncharacterized protein n=1 Tax=Medicago truncatula TaxID=3880 RepID=A0A396I0N9_MEDTR|nr:hypothetical protein MtrunA17_Chr5g0429371 [Medicago truncatula]
MKNKKIIPLKFVSFYMAYFYTLPKLEGLFEVLTLYFLNIKLFVIKFNFSYIKYTNNHAFRIIKNKQSCISISTGSTSDPLP